MTHDIDTLTHWTNIFIWIAAICATSFPILYMFSPWYKTQIGKVMMLQSAAFALAIDVTLLSRYWRPKDVVILFWMNAVVFGLLAFATASMTYLLWQSNYVRLHRKPKETLDGTRSPSE